MKSKSSMAVPRVSVLEDLLVTSSAEAVQRTGGYSFYITLNLKSVIPANQKIWCHASHYRFVGNNASFTTDATVLAARNGSKATCVAAVYFDWPNTD